ncbi:dentin sialophosphoprotein-like isoform X2 [Ranitomeya imitator]|uniref:dentin sialophosphoprotein-like isoform X2 n=1 Tax=Ranitomeya imitator TaxID=111125 RepID=UPI0037E77FA0
MMHSTCMNGERWIFPFSAIASSRDQSAESTEGFEETAADEENYMKQLQTIIPMHYEYLTPSSCAISKQSCHTVIGSCSRSAHCRCVYPFSDDGFVPCNSKMSDSPQTNVSQKERCSTNDLLFHREYRFNRKDVRTQQYPEYTNKIIASSTMPPRQWNKDPGEKGPVGAREDDVKNKVKFEVRKSFKENRREILALHQEVPSNSFVSEWKYPSGSVCKLKHLSSALICPKCDDDDDDDVDDDRDDDDGDTENLHKGAGKLSHQQILSKNFDGYKEEELEVEAQEYKEKRSCKSNKNGQMAETLQKSHKKKILKSNSKMEHNGKEVESQPIVKDLNNQTLPTKFEKVHDVELLGIVENGLFEEINDFEEISDSKDNELVKGKAKNPTPLLAELLNGQNSLKNNQTQNEGRVQSDSSQNDSSSESGGRQSVSDACFQVKEHQNVSGEAQCELSTPSRRNFITQNDETEEDKIRGERDSQREEQGEDDDDEEMLEGKLSYADIRISKTKEAKKCLMYGGKSEMTSNSEEEDDEESIDGNDPQCEIANIVVANDVEIKDTKSSEKKDDDDNDEKVDDDVDKKDVNEADDDDHDVDDDEFSTISREDGKTGDRIQNNDDLEEKCSIENNDNEAINEGEDESEQEEEQSSSKDQDEVEDTEGSEDEENLLACDNKDKGLEMGESDHNLSLKNMSEDGDLNMETSIRPLWLCCLKSCSRTQGHKKRQQRKRCSEDGSMDLLQLNPVESRSSFPEQESPVSPTSRHTEVASVIKAPSEDSSEEFSHNEKESEKSSPGRSDSEDDVHSFYD